MKKLMLAALLVLLPATSAFSQDLTAALKKLVAAGQVALTIPAQLGDLKNAALHLKPMSECLAKPGTTEQCKKIGCTSRKECIGVTLGEFVKLLDPSVKILLGTTTQAPDPHSPTKSTTSYHQGLIALALGAIPDVTFGLAKKFSAIKNSSAFKKIEPHLKKIQDLIVKMSNLTSTVQESIGMLNGLAFVLAPEAAIKSAPKVEVPPVTIPASEETDTEEEFGFE